MADVERYVVTVRMDADSFGKLNVLRQRYFPSERNHLPAHLTVFHALTIDQCLTLGRELPLRSWRRLALTFGPPILLGRGVAIPVARGELEARHERMVDLLGGEALTPQDRQPLRSHVTVQNKVSPQVAKEALAQILTEFSPWTGLGLGLDFWLYLGGPWEYRNHTPFL